MIKATELFVLNKDSFVEEIRELLDDKGNRVVCFE